MSQPAIQGYGIQILDDLHIYFPAVLYEPERFQSVSSLLQYVRTQAMEHGNRFTQLQRAYRSTDPLQTPPRRAVPSVVPGAPARPPRTRVLPSTPVPGVPHPPMNIITETYDITNLLNIPNLHAPQASGSGVLQNFLNVLGTMSDELQFNMEPVLVRPTLDQIEHASTLRSAVPADESQVCSICQEAYTEGQGVRTITHCHHSFHTNCIDLWFERDVHCPVCRFDVRDS